MNADTVTAAATCAQAALLVVAAVVAVRQVREARRIREEQAQPYGVLYLEPDPASKQLLNLVIKNIGTTAARDVAIDFDPSSREQLGRRAEREQTHRMECA